MAGGTIGHQFKEVKRRFRSPPQAALQIPDRFTSAKWMVSRTDATIIRISLFTMQKNDTNRPDTPCVAVCSTTFDDICRGCGRTADEVATWVVLTQEEKDAVWDRILAQGYPRRQS